MLKILTQNKKTFKNVHCRKKKYIYIFKISFIIINKKINGLKIEKNFQVLYKVLRICAIKFRSWFYVESCLFKNEAKAFYT